MKIILISCLVLLSVVSFAQCPGFPASLPDQDCNVSTPLSNNANVNSGSTFGICSNSTVATSFTNINLNGGVIRICSNTSISGNFNGGTIVVACGSTLSFPSGLIMNQNIGIINYGTVIVSGNLTFQNNNNFFYNEATTSRLYVSGNLSYPQNNGQNAYLKNNGYISINNNFNALDGGFTCLGPDSRIVCNNINYIQNCGGPTNRFTYTGNSNDPIIRYTGSATIKANFTASNFITIYRAPGAGALNTGGCGGGSFGNATVVNNAPAIANPSAPPNGSFIISSITFNFLPSEAVNFRASAACSL